MDEYRRRVVNNPTLARWRKALKDWKDETGWRGIAPRKGTREYNAVMSIFNHDQRRGQGMRRTRRRGRGWGDNLPFF